MKSAFFKVIIATLSLALLYIGITVDMSLTHAQDCSKADIGSKATKALKELAQRHDLRPGIDPKNPEQNNQLVDLIDKAFLAVTCTAKTDPLVDAKNVGHFLELWHFAKLYDQSNELNEGLIQSAGPEKTELLIQHLTKKSKSDKKYLPLLDALQTAKGDRPNG